MKTREYRVKENSNFLPPSTSYRSDWFEQHTTFLLPLQTRIITIQVQSIEEKNREKKPKSNVKHSGTI